MKKLIASIASVLVLALSINAQEKETFYPGWNWGFQIGANYTQGVGGFNSDLISLPTIGANLGYEFNPWFGLRGNLSGFQAKGILFDEMPQDPANFYKFNSGDPFKFNYVQLGIDAMFDICNIFKYRSERFCSPYIFAGIVGNFRFNNGAWDSVKALGTDYDYAWENPVIGLGGRLGLGANFRINDKVKISLELVDNIYHNRFNSMCDNSVKIPFLGKIVNDHEYIHLDENFSALLGVKFTFGQARAKAEAAAAAAAAAAAKAAADKAAAEKAAAEKAAREKAAREKAEAERLAAEKAAAEAAAAKAKALQDAKDAVNAALNSANAYPRFVIGKYDLTKEAKAKVAAAAEILKVNPAVDVVLTGYADKETGTAAGNMTLSENRAKAIADALVAEGVSASQLSTEWKGDTEIPFEGAKPAEKRTVTFQVK